MLILHLLSSQIEAFAITSSGLKSIFYEIEVRPGPETAYFQIYAETIEAPTSQDALARVQRRNPGCLLTLCRSWA
jgi:hypothetical protein